MGIIKNAERFSNIKLCKGIILDTVKTVNRDGNVGISTKTYGNKWHMLPKGKAIFKSFDEKNMGYTRMRKNRIVNELVCYELAKQMGIKCAECELATRDDKTGIVSYNVATKKETLISAYRLMRRYDLHMYSSNSLKEYAKLVDELKSDGYEVNKRQIMLDLFKIVVFDTLTLQTDRHADNFFFLIDEKKYKVKVAPLFDNEFAFCGQRLPEVKTKKYTTFNQVIKGYNDFADSLNVLIQPEYSKNKLKQNIADIIELACYSKQFNNVLVDLLNNCDIDKIIKKINMQGIEIDKSYTDYMKNVILISKAKILKQMQKAKQTKSIKENYEEVLER